MLSASLLVVLTKLQVQKVRKADTRWVDSKTSAIDRVIRLIIPIGSGAAAVTVGETVCETDCLLVLGEDPSAEGFLWTVTISEQTWMIIRVTKD
jgi:hypothetical protein